MTVFIKIVVFEPKTTHFYLTKFDLKFLNGVLGPKMINFYSKMAFLS